MNKFKVGDRVTLYLNVHDVNRLIAGETTLLRASTEQRNKAYSELVDYKKCRTVNPRKPMKTIWVDLKTKEVLRNRPGSFTDGDFVEFREVRKKK